MKKEAEAGGFEPPVRLPVRQFSKLVVSATHPNFLNGVGNELFPFCGCKGRYFFRFGKRISIFFRIFVKIFFAKVRKQVLLRYEKVT